MRLVGTGRKLFTVDNHEFPGAGVVGQVKHTDANVFAFRGVSLLLEKFESGL